jgi:hypothetical protein
MAIKALQPYVNEPRETDPMIARVAFPSLDIGARAGTLRDAQAGDKNIMGLQHVGGTTGGKR